MLLSKLIEGTDLKLIGGDADITRIEYDSRRVKAGELFACVVGTFKDGHEYAAGAVENGAAALICERELPLSVPQVIAPNSRRAMAVMAMKLYGYPAKGMRIIGVTGTNGKTTTTYMIKSVAEKCGLKVGLIGTIRNIIGDRVISTQRTTPESTELQEILRLMADEGVDLVVMEVSSHSLDQERVYGLEFEIGGFTNLTQDHLDYHKTFENYLAAKRKLFERSAFAVVNADDPYSEKLLEGLDVPRMTYAVREPADIYANGIEICVRDVEFEMTTPEGVTHVTVPIPGLFNVFNAMLAAGVCLKLGFPLDKISEGLAAVSGVTGRMEALPTDGFPFGVILDFAHTPDGLINLLTSVR
ncbi:MAG: UDP-N-acetylmuramoyl-L-alanyl-D-glutamate--2,6-diaminopimelate ligase, partial [Clostridia bacterium]|nr:UDP-N-acetylmuramoyl-L-alanyl-D-glutamate--2,6-diaminopimelate ligase [Clostridia bacterium]